MKVKQKLVSLFNVTKMSGETDSFKLTAPLGGGRDWDGVMRKIKGALSVILIHFSNKEKLITQLYEKLNFQTTPSLQVIFGRRINYFLY